MSLRPILIDGQWRASAAAGSFFAENPSTGQRLSDEYPVSSWADCDAALEAATRALDILRRTPSETIAKFLERFAERIEARASELVEMAHNETGLPADPRLRSIELPRTTGQLRQAATAAREGSWALPTIDTKQNIRSCYAALGPIWVFGPNNFPFAFNSVAGGDFVAAIACGNPVIGKANTSHPGTSRLLAEEAFQALLETGLPPATVQMIYRTGHEDGARLVADPRTGACGYTGSRSAGLKLKAAADAAGKPIYLELSSVNPVLLLPGALAERGEKIAEEFTASSLLGAGQFCTNPSLVVLLRGNSTDAFIASVRKRFETASPAPLLSSNVVRALTSSVDVLRKAGAEVVTGGAALQGSGHRFQHTLLRVSGTAFLKDPERLQTEAFGNVALLVVAENEAEVLAVLEHLEGNLTGCVYSDTRGADDDLYARVEPLLRWRVGRLLNDKMPTGVAVSSAMNHGGPYPSTGHPGFTAVGIPASLRRFAMLLCYDNVRAARLPALLRDDVPPGKPWRLVDLKWTQGSAA